MRLAILTSMALLLSAGCALAQGTTNTMTSGRPSAVLDDAQCQTIWKMASPDGATLSKDQAVPYIVNFSMVDVSGDGKITADEFKAACGKGLVKNQSSKNLAPTKPGLCEAGLGFLNVELREAKVVHRALVNHLDTFIGNLAMLLSSPSAGSSRP